MKKYQFMKDTDENGESTVNIAYKPKRKLDLLPRILCLFVALIIWLWMVNFNDTDVTETIIIKIDYAGLEMLESSGMMIYGMDKSEIAITVKGSNRDIKKHEAEEYKAVVDVSGIGEMGLYTLPLTVSAPQDSNVTIVESEPLNVSLYADLSEEKELTFDVLVSNMPEAGLLTYSYISEQSTDRITVKGPKQIIDMISYARFTVSGNFGGSSDDMKFSDFPLIFLDKNLNEVIVDGTVEYSTEDIEVKVSAIAHRSIPINVKVSGTGSELVPKPSVDSIEIWGVPSVVRGISSYTIDISNAELGKVIQHSLTNKDLPKDVYVNEDITVTVSFEEALDEHG